VKINVWLKSFIVTAVMLAIVFRVPQIRKIVVGDGA